MRTFVETKFSNFQKYGYSKLMDMIITSHITKCDQQVPKPVVYENVTRVHLYLVSATTQHLME